MAGRGEASGASSSSSFNFKTGELVLVKWTDGMVYFAKIKKIYHKRGKCAVVFDDKSQDEADFDQIHSVDETTTDIICIKCKKDDSDSPNEIVLCDTCGIGFHQKCHMPPIPAHALELDTPWNCTYCQKGTKCPYLTESLDVLQNLLSDDEQAQDGDGESLVIVESDQEDYEGATKVTITSGPVRRRKGRRGRLGHKRGLKPSTLSPHAWKQKLAKTHTRSSTSPFGDPDILSSPGSSVDVPVSMAGRKRRRPHAGGGLKRQKRSSVESHTVSVQRLSGPLLEDSSGSPEQDHSRDSPTFSDREPSPPPPVSSEPLLAIKEEPLPVDNTKRPRSLRVSLSIPDEVEPGTPLDKVVTRASSSNHSTLLQATPTSNLPLWDDITAQKSSVPQTLSPLQVSSFPKPSTPVTSPAQSHRLRPTESPVVEVRTVSMLASSLASQKGVLSDTSASKAAGETNSPKQPGMPSPPLSNTSDDVFESTDSPPAKVSTTQRMSTPVSSQGAPTPTLSATEPKVASRPKVMTLPKTTAESPIGTNTSGAPVVAMLASPLPKTFMPSSKATEHTTSSPRGTPPPRSVTDQLSVSIATLPKPPERSSKETLQVGYQGASTNSDMASNEVATPLFTQGQLESKVLVSTITDPKAPRASLQQLPKLSAGSQSPVPVSKVIGAAGTKLVSPQHTPVQSLASNTASATPTTTRMALTSVQQMPASTRPTNLPKPMDTDVVITGVSGKKEGHVLPEHVLPASGDPSLNHPMPQQQRPHNLRTIDSRTKKVIAKTVDIHQPHQSLSSLSPSTGAGVVMTPTANQTLPLQTLVVTPDAYSYGSSSDGKTLLIPSTAVGQAGQVVYALPAVDSQAESSPGVIISSQAQPQVHYIIKDQLRQKPPPPYRPPISRSVPAVTSGVAPTTLVYTQAAPVAHSVSEQELPLPVGGQDGTATQLQPAHSQASVVYYTVPSTQAGTLSTTKPYAFVTALPTSADSRGLVTIPQSSVQAAGGRAQLQVHASRQVVPAASRGQVGVVTYSHPSQRKQNKVTVVSKAGSTSAATRDTASDDDLAKTLQSIAHNIGTAFLNYNEDMLLAAFEDAWKKFQANSRKYEALARLENSAIKVSTVPTTSKHQAPPNAEVVNTPGISKLSLVRPTNAKPKPIVPKPAGTPTITNASLQPSTPSANQPQSQQYITYAYSPVSSQAQVIVQPVNPSDAPYTIYTVAPKQPAQKSYQSGLFYPSPPVSEGSTSHKPDSGALTSAANHQVVFAQPVVQQRAHVQGAKPANDRIVTRRIASTQIVSSPKVVQQLPPKQKQTVPVRRRTSSKQSRSCALCGKEATYLCSGCHSEWYCGRECQLTAWDDHSEHCK